MAKNKVLRKVEEVVDDVVDKVEETFEHKKTEQKSTRPMTPLFDTLIYFNPVEVNINGKQYVAQQNNEEFILRVPTELTKTARQLIFDAYGLTPQ